MGGKKSKAPKAPDYAAAATAQGAADLKTAQYTTALDRPTQINPYGQTTWQFGGGVPTNSAPSPQYISAQKNVSALSQQLAALKASPIKSGRGPGQDYISAKSAKKQRDQQVAALQSKLTAAQKTMQGYSAGGGGAYGSMTDPKPGDWKQITTLTPAEQRIFDAEQANRLGMENLTKTGISRVGSTISKAFNPNVSGFKPAQGMRGSNVGLPSYMADRVGLAQYLRGNMAIPKYAQKANAPGMAADGYAMQGYNQQENAPGMGADNIGVAGNTLEGLQDVNESADQFGAQGQQVRDALYQQMTQFSDDRFGRAEQAERTRLSQMGLQEGSKAYTNALKEFNRSKDESYQTAQLNSILAGGQEQSRMIGDQLASRQSNIGLRQGQFGQNMARDQQDMAERAQNYGAAANQYGQNQSERQFGFNAGLSMDQQDMAERAQQYGAASNQYGQNQQERQFGFNADMQGFEADQGERQFAFGANMARDQQDMAERMNMFNTGAQRYGMDQSERQAQATSQLNLAQQAAAQRQQMFNEEAYKRSLPINEVSALLGGGGVNMPQFPGFAPSTPFNAPDLLGAANAQYGAAMNQYNAGQSQKGGLLGAGAGLLGSFMGGK